jgi:hypothetical protein
VRMRTGEVLDWQGQHARAVEIYRADLPDARKLAKLRPRDSQDRMQEAVIYSNMARSYAVVDHAQFLIYAREQVQSMVRVAQDFRDNRDVKLELAGAYSQLGQALHVQVGLNITEPVDRATGGGGGGESGRCSGASGTDDQLCQPGGDPL